MLPESGIGTANQQQTVVAEIHNAGIEDSNDEEVEDGQVPESDNEEYEDSVESLNGDDSDGALYEVGDGGGITEERGVEVVNQRKERRIQGAAAARKVAPTRYASPVRDVAPARSYLTARSISTARSSRTEQGGLRVDERQTKGQRRHTVEDEYFARDPVRAAVDDARIPRAGRSSARTVSPDTDNYTVDTRYETKQRGEMRYSSHVTPPAKWIKPDKFVPPAPLESYLSHFETIATYNGWDEYDKTAHLKAALSAEAAQLLWDGGDHAYMTYDDVVNELRSRFGSAAHNDRYAAKLRTLRRRDGQDLQDLYNDVCKFMALAYPGTARTRLNDVFARDAFIAALNDRELEIKVRDRDPEDLEMAFRAAVKVEGYLQAGMEDRGTGREARPRRERFDEQHRARHVQNKNDSDSSSIKFREEIQKRMDEYQKTQTELNKKLDKLQLLMESKVSNRNPQQTDARPQTNTGRRSEDHRSSNRPCYSCGEVGHFARDCQTEAPRVNTNPPGAMGTNFSRQVHDPDNRRLDRAAYLSLRIRRRNVKCLLDTGSEVCLFPARYAGASSSEPSGQHLAAANGTEIKIIGKVMIEAVLSGQKLIIEGYASPHVDEIILGLGFLKAHGVLWDFTTGSITMYGKSFKLLDRDMQGVCRRVILEEAVEIPPRSEIVLPAYVRYKGAVHTNGEWATVPKQLAPHLHVARTLLPARALNIPVRLINTGDQKIALSEGTELATVEEVEVRSPPVEDVMNENRVKEKLIEEMMEKIDEIVSDKDKQEMERLLYEYSDAFSFSDADIGHATACKHNIDVAEAPPARQRLRRQPPAHQAAVDKHVQSMLEQGIIEPAQSPWAANLVMVLKKTGEYRCCVDYRALNNVTKKDAYCLPRIDACLDAMAGSAWFSTFDLRSSYYQVELEQASKEKTAFICRGGQYQYVRMPMGLCNSGATFQRLVDITLTGLSYDICMVYIDDVIVYSRTLGEQFERLRLVLARLIQAGLKIKTSKTFLLQKSVSFLGHLVSGDGVRAHLEKTEQILNWGRPTCTKDVRAFIGLTSYYRRFVNQYAQVVSPLTALLGKNKPFNWSEECESAFTTLKRALANPPLLAMPVQGQQYILDCDASDFAIAGVLSQVQDGETRVIAYASRKLSQRERNYCVTRRELLAVVNYIKYFRAYLLGADPPVKVRTDHAALTWLRNIPEPVGQQARWLETMQEYNFTIEHRAGRSHGNADGMSRDPCHNARCCPSQEIAMETEPPARIGVIRRKEIRALGSEFTGRKEQIKEAQSRDSNISPILDLIAANAPKPSWDWAQPRAEEAKALWHQWDRLANTEGVLVRVFEEADGTTSWPQIIMPKEIRAEFLRDAHTGVGGGHLGRHRTELAVRARAYWPGWHEDIRRALRTCNECAQYHRGQPARSTHLSPIVCGEPWELLSLDITGPHPASAQGHCYILTMQDNFTKWAEAFAIRRHTAPIVAHILFHQVIMRFGCPRRILSDRGPEFEGEIMAELCTLMQIDKVRSTPFHPQSNGMLERFHRTLNSMLGKVVEENQRDWHEHLAPVMAAYRATVHEATGFTPNRLMFGREVTLPVDLVYGVPNGCSSRESVSVNDCVDKMVYRAQQDFESVRESLHKAAEARKKRYDVKVLDLPKLEPGQLVHYFYPRRYSGKSPKWQKMYTGPYTVVRVINDHVVLIRRTPRSRIISVHRDKLKIVRQEAGFSNFLCPRKMGPAVQSDREAFQGQEDDEKPGDRPKRVVKRPQHLEQYYCGRMFFVSGESSRDVVLRAVPPRFPRPLGFEAPQVDRPPSREEPGIGDAPSIAPGTRYLRRYSEPPHVDPAEAKSRSRTRRGRSNSTGPFGPVDSGRRRGCRGGWGTYSTRQ